MRPDLFEHTDYYLLDELLTDEHKLVREATREWVKRDISPIIEEYAQKAKFPEQTIKGLASIGAFGPYIPTEYGGAGLDQISYGLMMQEIERGDSGVRSTCSVQSSLVMFPIYKYAEKKKKKLHELNINELNKIEPKLTKDVLKIFDLEYSVRSKKSYGGTSFDNIKKMITKHKKN